jgi:hypothetical protein
MGEKMWTHPGFLAVAEGRVPSGSGIGSKATALPSPRARM